MGIIARLIWAYVRLLAMTAAWMTAAVVSLGPERLRNPKLMWSCLAIAAILCLSLLFGRPTFEDNKSRRRR
jgi:hypothetical protein